MSMFNMGSSFAGEFGAWFTSFLGVTLNDFIGLPGAQGARIFVSTTHPPV
jgi:hypothetical protein